MSFTLHRPRSPEEALLLRQQTGGAFLAGGTVLMVDLRRGKAAPQDVISLHDIPALHTLEETAEELLLPALFTFDGIEESPLCRDHAFALWQAAREVGGPQVRNRATLGGNLAAGSPSADSAAPLLALGASVTLQSMAGERTLPLSSFFLAPGQTALRPDELLTVIRIPKAGLCSRFRKVGRRQALSVSAASLAVAARQGGEGLTAFSVAAGSVAPTPRYCGKTAACLNGGALTPERLEEAGRILQTEISPIDDRWATAKYRRVVCGNLLPELIKELKGGNAE